VSAHLTRRIGMLSLDSNPTALLRRVHGEGGSSPACREEDDGDGDARRGSRA
jgi:hypothetical protein